MVTVIAGLWLGWAGLSRIRRKGFPRLPLGGAYGLAVIGTAIVVAGLTLPPQFMHPNTTPPPSSSATRPASTATLAIVQPAEGRSVSGAQLEVVMTLDGGRIVDTASTRLTPDTGHVHLSLDGRLVSMTYGLVQLVEVQGLSPEPTRSRRSSSRRTTDLSCRGSSLARRSRWKGTHEPPRSGGARARRRRHVRAPARHHRVGSCEPGRIGPGRGRPAGTGAQRRHAVVHGAARSEAVQRPRPGRQRCQRGSGAGGARVRQGCAPGPAAGRAPRRRVHGQLARRLRGGRTCDGRSVQLRGERGTGGRRHAERADLLVAAALDRRRRGQGLPLRRSRAVVRGGHRGHLRVRRSGARSARCALDRGGGDRGRRGRHALRGAGDAGGIDGRPPVVVHRYRLSLAPRRSRVRGHRVTGRGAPLRPALAGRGRGRRGGGHAHPRQRRSRRRRGDPDAGRRPAVVPLHGRERVDRRPGIGLPAGP